MATLTTTSQADMIVAATLNQAVYDLIADRVDLRFTTYMADDPSGSGSAAVKIPQVQFDEIMTAPGEGASVASSNLADGETTLTVARYATRYDSSDLLQMIMPNGNLDLARLAAGISMSARRAAAKLICEAIDGFSNTAGTTGTVLTVDGIYDAIFLLEIADVPGGDSFCVLKPKAFTEFQSSLRGEGGAVQYQAATAEMLAMKGQGFKGMWNGIDFWTSQQVQDDATDYQGALYGRGAVAMTEATPRLLRDRIPVTPFLNVAVDDSAVWVELERSAAGGLTMVVGNYYPAAAINEDDRGVTLLSAV